MDRLLKLKESVLHATPEICPERALLITKAYRETEGQPMVLRRAKALSKVLAGRSGKC